MAASLALARGQQHAGDAVAPRGRRNRQHAARRLNRAVERQLAEHDDVGDRRGARRCPAPRGCRAQSAGRTTTPALRTSAGARLTVMRCGGNSKPELRIALRTRSRLSRTLASGRPTIVKSGRPNETSTSTWTGQASTPKRAAVRRQASTRRPAARAAARPRGEISTVFERRSRDAAESRAPATRTRCADSLRSG